jgi:RHS repeat-associated protein
MVSATVSSVTTTFAYRGDGLRNSKTTGGVTTTFTWDIAGGLPVVLDDGNQYLYGAGLVAQKQSGSWWYYLSDGLGSTMAVVDSSGNTQDSYTYDIYGAPTKTGSLANEFDFAGQQTDGSTGLQYLRARYVDPATGRFLSRDPLEAQGQHPYGYAGGNPTNAADPNGTRICWGDDDCESGPPNAGCSGYTYGMGVCRGGGWNGAPEDIAARLNKEVKHGNGSKFASVGGGVNFCSDVGKKSASRTIAIGHGEYAGACRDMSVGDVDPNVTCQGKVYPSYAGIYGGNPSGGVYGGDCFNQFGGKVGGFSVSLDSVDPANCAWGGVGGAVEAFITAAIFSSSVPGPREVVGSVAVGCALAQTWADLR